MDNNQNPKEFHLYSDIRERTGGEIYIGVVGPVRTGKSTFIKRCILQVTTLYLLVLFTSNNGARIISIEICSHFISSLVVLANRKL